MMITLQQLGKLTSKSKNRLYLVKDSYEARQGPLARDGSRILLLPFDYQLLRTALTLMEMDDKPTALAAVDRSIAINMADEAEIEDGNLRLTVALRRLIAEYLTMRPELAPQVTAEVYQRIEDLIELLIELLKYVPPTIYPVPEPEVASEGAPKGEGETPNSSELQDECRMAYLAADTTQSIGASGGFAETQTRSKGDDDGPVLVGGSGEIHADQNAESGYAVALLGNPDTRDESLKHSDLAGAMTVPSNGSVRPIRVSDPVRDSDLQEDGDERRHDSGSTPDDVTDPKGQAEVLYSVQTFMRFIEQGGVIQYVLNTEPSEFLIAAYCLHSILPEVGRKAVMVANSWADFVEQNETQINSTSSLPEDVLDLLEHLEYEITEHHIEILNAIR